MSTHGPAPRSPRSQAAVGTGPRSLLPRPLDARLSPWRLASADSGVRDLAPIHAESPTDAAVAPSPLREATSGRQLGDRKPQSFKRLRLGARLAGDPLR